MKQIIKNKTAQEVLHKALIVIVFLLCARFVRIPSLEALPFVQTIYARASLVCAFCVLVVYAVWFRKTPKLLQIAMVLFFALLFLSSILAEGNLRRVISAAYPPIALSLFVAMECSTEGSAKRFVRTLADLFMVLAAVNLFQMLLLPNLFERTETTNAAMYILGHENQIGYPLTVGMLITLLNSSLNQERWKCQVYTIIYTVTTFVNLSMGSLMGFAFLLLYMVPGMEGFFKKRSFMLIAGLFSVILVVLVLWGEDILSVQPFRFIIEDIFGKDPTLTHRTTIWEAAVNTIAKRPLWGYGYRDTTDIFLMKLWHGVIVRFSAHNQFLQTLMEGGLLAFGGIVVTVFVTAKGLERSPDKKIAADLKVFLLAVLVMYLTEAPGWDVLFFVMSLAMYIPWMMRKQQDAFSRDVAQTDTPSDKISVVIPVYNVKQFLPACLDSVVQQTYRNLEIIIVNDGSTDESFEICKAYAKEDPRIVLVDQENQGLSGARNSGIRKATGTYITFIDSDDVLQEDMLEYLLRLIKCYDADMSVCQKRLIDGRGDPIADDWEYRGRVLRGNENCMDAFFRLPELEVCAWGKLYKREMFRDTEYPLGKYHEDVFTTHLLVEKCQCIAAGEQRMYLYRQREGSIVNSMFTPKHLHGVEGSISRYEQVKDCYPRSKRLAESGILWSANACVKRLLNTQESHVPVVTKLQKCYRQHIGAFLLGNSGVHAKAFALLATINLRWLLKAGKALKRQKRKEAQ